MFTCHRFVFQSDHRQSILHVHYIKVPTWSTNIHYLHYERAEQFAALLLVVIGI